MYALDTNTFIHALKGVGHVRRRLVLTGPADIAIPAIALYELTYGTLRSSNPQKRQAELDRLLSLLTVLPFDGHAANSAARIRLDLERGGMQIGPLDTLIAGTVLAYGAILVTHNVDKFSRVAGLQIEDWY